MKLNSADSFIDEPTTTSSSVCSKIWLLVNPEHVTLLDYLYCISLLLPGLFINFVLNFSFGFLYIVEGYLKRMRVLQLNCNGGIVWDWRLKSLLRFPHRKYSMINSERNRCSHSEDGGQNLISSSIWKKIWWVFRFTFRFFLLFLFVFWSK